MNLQMNRKDILLSRLSKCLLNFDFPLLLFLGMVTYSSLIIKTLGLIFIYLVRPNFKFQLKEERIPLFYLVIPMVAIFQIFTIVDLNNPKYILILALATLFWVASFLITHQLKHSIELSGIQRVKNTLEVFLILNGLLSIFSVLKIMLLTHTINPYMYAGMNYHYHVSTGDHIKGIFRDVSTTNSWIMMMGLIYFIHQKKYWQSILCLCIVLLTTSNIVNIILLFLLVGYIVFIKSKITRAVIIVLTGILIIFLIKVSPNNLRYLSGKIFSNELFKDLPTENVEVSIQKNEEDEIGNEEVVEKNEVEEINIYREIYAKENLYQRQKHNQDILADSLFFKQQRINSDFNLSFSKRVYGDSLTSCTSILKLKNSPGKIISFAQTYNSLTKDASSFLIGKGMGNYSSKIAFKATGFNIFGNYPSKYQYISNDLKDNHLKVLTYFFIQSRDKHSVINTPFSVYNQLFGEYGILGFILFGVFYLGFFLKKFKYLSFGRILLPLLLLIFFTDYWFEQISVVVIFEMLMYIDLNLFSNPKSEHG